MKRNDFIRKMEQRLVNRRMAIRRVLAGDVNSLSSVTDTGVGDEIDATVLNEQAEIEGQLAEVESRELGRIDAALEKIRQGLYGRCEACGQSIKVVRLQAVPYATECIRCARSAERRTQRFGTRGGWDRIDSGETNSEVSLEEAEAQIESN
jgi:RNA polymerase-binding transcription factor